MKRVLHIETQRKRCLGGRHETEHVPHNDVHEVYDRDVLELFAYSQVESVLDVILDSDYNAHVRTIRERCVCRM